jgi:hypothetical protein
MYATDYAIDGCNPIITNTTVANNSANLCGGVRVRYSAATLNNSIIQGNTHTNGGEGSQIYMSGTGSSTTLNYSCYSNEVNDVYGILTPANCITTDPLFYDPDNDDFRITYSSPCKEAGQSSVNSEQYDIRGNDRTQGAIDMGAYEFTEGTDPDAPFPVELISFSGSVYGSIVELKWETATEINNYGFEVQRNNPPLSPLPRGEENGWVTIGFIDGHGNSNSPKQYSFSDESVTKGNYSYRLKQIDLDGKFEYSGVIEMEIDTSPKEFSLAQNYPNPFNPTTTIKYQIPNAGNVSLKIFDVLGAEVMTLVNAAKAQGRYEVSFDASKLAGGVYIYRIQSNDFVASRKMMLLK